MQIGLEDTLWLCSFYFSSEWKVDIGLNKLDRAWVIALTFAETNTAMFLLAFNIYPLGLNIAIKPFVPDMSIEQYNFFNPNTNTQYFQRGLNNTQYQ